MFVVYVIDTSSWIDLARKYPVGKDPIWNKLQTLIDDKRIISPIEVFDELEYKKDCEPYNWCKQNKQMFIETSDEMESMVIALGNKNRRWRKRMGAGYPTADPHIISLAKYYVDPQRKFDKTSIVTGESPTRKLGIPKIADEYGVECISLYEFIKQIS